MDVTEVREAVRKIRSRAREDYESAHGMEDELYRSVLHAIASGSCEDHVGIAKEALKTQKIKFNRVCA